MDNLYWSSNFLLIWYRYCSIMAWELDSSAIHVHGHIVVPADGCTCRYDKKDTSKLVLTDIHFMGAMGPPGGGRNPITPRFIRHFNVITVNDFDDNTMTRIFSNIINFSLKASSHDEVTWVGLVIQVYMTYITYRLTVSLLSTSAVGHRLCQPPWRFTSRQWRTFCPRQPNPTMYSIWETLLGWCWVFCLSSHRVWRTSGPSCVSGSTKFIVSTTTGWSTARIVLGCTSEF